MLRKTGVEKKKSVERYGGKPIIWPSLPPPLQRGPGSAAKWAAAGAKQNILKTVSLPDPLETSKQDFPPFKTEMSTKVFFFIWNSVVFMESLVKNHNLYGQADLILNM